MFANVLWNSIFFAVVTILVFTVVGKLLKWALNSVGRKLVSKTQTAVDDRIVQIIASHVVAISVLVGFVMGLGEVQTVLKGLNKPLAHVLSYAELIPYVLLVVVLTRMLAQVVGTIFAWYFDQVSQKTASNIAATVTPLMNKILNIVLFLVAAIIVLDHFGINIGSLLVSLGVASLAVALAAQDTLANMIAGFVIMIDRPFRVGDRVQLLSGSIGDVYEIGLRSTRIMDFDNNLIIIPNAELIKSHVINYSYPRGVVRIVVNVGVKYTTDVDRAKRLMVEIAKRQPNVLSDPPPEAFLVNFGDSALELRLIAHTADFRKKFLTECTIREEMLGSFNEEGIEIPYPQRVVHFAENTDGTQTASAKKAVRRKSVQPRRR